MKMTSENEKNNSEEHEPVVSKQLWLALIVYPIVLAFMSLFLIRIMGAKGLSSAMDMFSMFIFIASIFSLIPALSLCMFALPSSMSSKDNRKTQRAGAMVKITSAFIAINGILFFLSLFMF